MRTARLKEMLLQKDMFLEHQYRMGWAGEGCWNAHSHYQCNTWSIMHVITSQESAVHPTDLCFTHKSFQSTGCIIDTPYWWYFLSWFASNVSRYCPSCFWSATLLIFRLLSARQSWVQINLIWKKSITFVVKHNNLICLSTHNQLSCTHQTLSTRTHSLLRPRSGDQYRAKAILSCLWLFMRKEELPGGTFSLQSHYIHHSSGTIWCTAVMIPLERREGMIVVTCNHIIHKLSPFRPDHGTSHNTRLLHRSNWQNQQGALRITQHRV